jgi:dTDP-4-dehydrorhamnose reductase
MRLLITGAGGLLGMNLALGAMRTHTVVGLDRGALHNAPFDLLQVDLVNAGALVGALHDSRPDAVIHCAAMADVDACERNPTAAWQVNATVPRLIAELCQREAVRLIHISTDAVFDGTASAPYGEQDRPSPTSVYARTKAAAEEEVLGAYPAALVARVNFYGWSPTGRRSLAEYFVNSLVAGAEVKGFTDVIFCPMLVTDLGALLLRMLENGLNGLYHAVGPEPMSKYDFGVALARTFGLDSARIIPDTVDAAGLAARRAHNLALSVHKLSTAIREPLPAFSTGLAEFHRQFREGYPQLLRSYQQLSTVEGPIRTGTQTSAGTRPE